MEQSEPHIYYIDEDKKGRLKYFNALICFGTAAVLILCWEYDLLINLHRFKWMDELLPIVCIMYASKRFEKGNKKINLSRLEIDNVRVAIYVEDELQDSIQMGDVATVKYNWRGIKLESKNVTLYDVIVSKNYESFDEIEALIKARVNITSA